MTPRRSPREPQHSPCLVKSPRVRQKLHVTATLACPSHHPDRSNRRSPPSLVPPLFPLAPSSSPIAAPHGLMHTVPSSGSKVSRCGLTLDAISLPFLTSHFVRSRCSRFSIVHLSRPVLYRFRSHSFRLVPSCFCLAPFDHASVSLLPSISCFVSRALHVLPCLLPNLSLSPFVCSLSVLFVALPLDSMFPDDHS